MAENYTPEEIEELIRVADAEMRLLGRHTKETADALKDAAIGVKNYTATLNASYKALGTSIRQLGKGMVDGATGASTYSDALEKGADVISNFATKFGAVGKVVGLAVKAVGAYTSAVNRQADALYKSYQDIASAGAGTARGIADVFENMQRLGYGIDELNNFGTIIKNNSELLSNFGSTVGQGIKTFSGFSNDIRTSDIGFQFRNMGMSVDAINDGIAGYLKLQTLTGTSAKRTQDELVRGAAEYVKELDLLTKITGKRREEAQAAQESAMLEERFAAFMYELEQQGTDAARMQAQEIRRTLTILDKLAPETKKGFLNILSGTLDNAESAKLLQTLPRAAAVAGQQTFTSAEFLKAAGEDLKENLKGNNLQLAKIGANNDTYIAFQEQLRLSSYLEGKTIEDRIAAAKSAQTVTDSATTSMTSLIDAQRDTRDSLQKMINLGIDPVTDKLKILAQTVNRVTAIPGAVTPKAAPAGGSRTSGQTMGMLGNERSLIEKLSASGINDRRAQANILAQIAAESGGTPRSENLNYTPEQLVKMFPNRVGSLEDARALVAQGAEAVGNRIYGGRMGNAANEGYLYRGRGLIQLTGKNNYAKFGKMLGIDLVNNPDLANEPSIAREIAVAYFKEKQKAGVNLSDIKDIGRAVGYVDVNGEETRRRSELSQSYLDRLPQAALGGILSGAQSGFAAALHGTEAVVPLPDGKTIPVEMKGAMITSDQIDRLTSALSRLETSTNGSGGLTPIGNTDTMSIMSQQLSRLDDIVRAMQNQVAISQKILNYTN